MVRAGAMFVVAASFGFMGCGAPPRFVIGFARNGATGAVIDTGERILACGDRAAWSAAALDRPVAALAALGPAVASTHAAGASAGWQLASCGPPPSASDAGLLAAEQAIFDGLARRDAAALAARIAPEARFRVAGTAGYDRAGFLREVAALPELIAVFGEGLVTHRAGDVGIVAGVQVSRVRLDGQEIEARGAFVDLFERRGGAWVLTLAVVADEPTAGAEAAGSHATPQASQRR